VGTPKVVPVETKKVGLLAWNSAKYGNCPSGTLVALGLLLLERPQPIGFVLVGIITCRLRYQLRAFLAEVVETTLQLFPGESGATVSRAG
jgi:hypothetical protein